jgi:CDGSH-type Zn-finger protein
MSPTHGHMAIAPPTAAETYCRCGYETELPFCPTCGSADRFTFTATQAQERRLRRWMYLVAGLVLQAVAIGATVWMLS